MKNLVLLLLLGVISCNVNDMPEQEIVLGEIVTEQINEAEILRLVNQARTIGYEIDNTFYTSSLGEVTWDEKLEKASQIQTVYMFQTEHYNHDWTDGTDLSKRLSMADCRCSSASENIAKGNLTEQSVFNGWMKSKPHREAIMRSSFNVIGVSKKGLYWTMVLGYKKP